MVPQSVPSTAAASLDTDERALVDVREDDEWAAGHAPQAQHLPLQQVPERLGALPEGPLAITCRSGGRSAQATAYLRQQGYDAVNVDGGMHAWVAAGRELVSEDGQDPRVA